MNVIKKSGNREPFSVEKLERSIRAANQGTGEVIDMPRLIEGIKEVISGRAEVETTELDLVVIALLYANEHYHTILAYRTYEG